MSSIHKPVFIVGSGRSGTTIFHRTLARHPDLAAFTNYDVAYPRLFNSGILPLMETFPVTRALMNAVRPIVPAQETEGIMRHSGLSSLGVPVVGCTAPRRVKKRLKKLIARCIRYQSATRYLSKNTNDGLRMSIIDSLFPDCFFVHVIRDGRANTSSYLKVPFFNKIGFWWRDNRTLADWTAEGRTAAELAALHWQHNVTEIRRQGALVPDNRYIEVRYEDFTERPLEIFRQTADFCGLQWTPDFEASIRNTEFKNMNHKWLSLPEEDRETISRILSYTLTELGYLEQTSSDQ